MWVAGIRGLLETRTGRSLRWFSSKMLELIKELFRGGDGDADWWWRWTLQDFTGDGNHDDFGHSYDDNASKVNTSVDDAAWVDGGTHLLATVHTEETGYDLYVDDLGVISSLADNGSLREDGVNSLWLGYDSAGGLYFASDIFMALLYTRPLSDSEISALYDKTKAAIRG